MKTMVLHPRMAMRPGSWIPILCRILALAILACLPLDSARAQSKFVIKGTLEDSTGAAVPGVDVKLRSVPGGHEWHASSDEGGYFQFDALPPGKYVVDVATQGFEEVVLPVEISVKSPPPLRVTLQLAQVKEQVTVREKAVVVPQAQQNSDNVQLHQDSFANLPIKDGDPLAVPSLFLEPASVGAQGPQIIVDGVESSSLDIPTTSIREVAVNKSPYTAEYARPGKGRIEVVTRKGSHHVYRGMVSLLARNSALDARNPFATTTPELQRGIVEAQLSGPITRHLSFFTAGRYYTNNQASVINAVVPTGPFTENFMAPTRNEHAFGRLDYDHHGRKLTLLYKFKDKSKRFQNVGEFNLPSTATDLFDQENELKVLETETLSDHSLNQARFTFKREPQGVGSLTDQPAIIVPGSFTAGGAQLAQGLRETSLTGEDIFSWTGGRHTLRMGGQVKPRFFDTYDRSNFDGTFQFPSLAAFQANKPILFTINEGNPAVSFSQNEYFTFLQDEYQPYRNLSFSLGVRYEFQSNLNEYHNIAPRFAFAFAPGNERTVIRAGAGIFYDRQPPLMEQDALLYNGQRIRQFVMQNPIYPLPQGSSIDETIQTPSVMRIQPGIVTPYMAQENLTIEHQFGNGRNVLTLDYTAIQGVHLYRLRNINAPLPGTLVPPNPNFVNIDQFESSGISRSNALSVGYQTTLRRRFDFTAQYVYSKSEDNTPGILPSSMTDVLFFPVTLGALFPANSYDLSGEWGLSNYDRRHRFNLVSYYRMPWGFRTGAVVSLNSGMPYNITTGYDNNHDTILNDRPPGVGRNTGHGPGYADVDFHVGKEFRVLQVAETARMELGVDAFNLFNTVNYKDYVGVMTSPFFGFANAALPARTIQMSVRLNFGP